MTWEGQKLLALSKANHVTIFIRLMWKGRKLSSISTKKKSLKVWSLLNVRGTKVIVPIESKSLTLVTIFICLMWRGRKYPNFFTETINSVKRKRDESYCLYYLSKTNGTIFIKLKLSKAHTIQVIHLQCILFSSKARCKVSVICLW